MDPVDWPWPHVGVQTMIAHLAGWLWVSLGSEGAPASGPPQRQSPLEIWQKVGGNRAEGRSRIRSRWRRPRSAAQAQHLMRMRLSSHLGVVLGMVSDD